MSKNSLCSQTNSSDAINKLVNCQGKSSHVSQLNFIGGIMKLKDLKDKSKYGKAGQRISERPRSVSLSGIRNSNTDGIYQLKTNKERGFYERQGVQGQQNRPRRKREF